MSPQASRSLVPVDADRPRFPVAPTEEEWRAMPQAVRARFIEEVNVAHSQAMEAMAEGRPHSRAKGEQAQALARAEANLERAEANLQRAILAIARLRGWALSPEAEARILACKDPGLLERWVQRAPVVATLEDLFLDA